MSIDLSPLELRVTSRDPRTYVTTYMPQSLRKRLVALAVEKELSASTALRIILERYLDAYEREKANRHPTDAELRREALLASRAGLTEYIATPEELEEYK